MKQIFSSKVLCVKAQRRSFPLDTVESDMVIHKASKGRTHRLNLESYFAASSHASPNSGTNRD